MPLKVLGCHETEQIAEGKLWARAADFEPPFQVRFVTFGKEAEEGALVHLAVSHMVSDGYSIMPMLDDLAHLVAREEAGGAELPPLPSLPNMFPRSSRGS